METIDYYTIAEILDGNSLYIANRAGIEHRLGDSIQDKINLTCLEKFSLSERIILLYLESDRSKSESLLNNLKYKYRTGGLDDYTIKSIKQELARGHIMDNSFYSIIAGNLVLKLLYRKESTASIFSWHTIEDDTILYGFYRDDKDNAVFRVNNAVSKEVIIEVGPKKLRELLGLGRYEPIRVSAAGAIIDILDKLGKHSKVDSLVVSSRGVGLHIQL